jgi:phage terminase large subunit-like protein
LGHVGSTEFRDASAWSAGGHSTDCYYDYTTTDEVVARDLADPGTKTTTATTYDNRANLDSAVLSHLEARYANTRIGRQELLAELLVDTPGALWSQAMLDDHRVAEAPTTIRRLIVGVDPSGGGSAETGVVVCGRGDNGHAYVLADRSMRGSPEAWGKRAIAAYHEFRADKIVCEKNFGGDMITAVIRNIDPSVTVQLVVASRGKAVRAEPVATAYEQGKVHHVGVLPVLEDQLGSWDPDGNDPSPDRLDALVWCITELMSGWNMIINPKALEQLRSYSAHRRAARGY